MDKQHTYFALTLTHCPPPQYLRVSPTLVLPCILYLDPRHVRWLNSHPSVFHSALEFLKKRILTKLDREAKVIRLNAGDAAAGSGKKPHYEKRIWGEISGKEVVDVARQRESNASERGMMKCRRGRSFMLPHSGIPSSLLLPQADGPTFCSDQRQAAHLSPNSKGSC